MVYTTSISHPNMFSTVTGETIVDTALESINRCISLLILTGFTELFGNPAFGSGIYEAQFDYVTDAYKDQLKLIISDAIARFESRVTCDRDNIYVTHNPENNHIFIRVGYTIKGSNQYSETIINMEVQS